MVSVASPECTSIAVELVQLLLSQNMLSCSSAQKIVKPYIHLWISKVTALLKTLNQEIALMRPLWFVVLLLEAYTEPLTIVAMLATICKSSGTMMVNADLHQKEKLANVKYQSLIKVMVDALRFMNQFVVLRIMGKGKNFQTVVMLAELKELFLGLRVNVNA